MESSQGNKIKSIKNWFMVIILFYFSSIVTEGARTKLAVSFKCALKGIKKRKRSIH